MTTTWTLHTEDSSIVVSGLEATTPTVTDGTQITTELYLYPDKSRDGFRERYTELREYSNINGDDVLRFGTSDVGTPWFRERYPDSMPVDSLLIGVEPGDSTIDTRGWWGLLTGLEDDSNPVADLRVMNADWFILSRFEDFESHADVRNELGTEIV